MRLKTPLMTTIAIWLATGALIVAAAHGGEPILAGLSFFFGSAVLAVRIEAQLDEDITEALNAR